MADEMKDEQGAMLGEFRLGRRYEEVGPEIGRFYEARNVRTERPAVVLLPGTGVDWQLQGDWRVRLSRQRKRSWVKVEVEQVPAASQRTKRTNGFALLADALQKVEGNAQLRAHLLGPRTPGKAPGEGRAGWTRIGWVLAAVGLALLLLGLVF